LRNLSKQGKTILFVSHDLGSVSKYCDRVILLNKGVKMDEGSPKQMVDLYKQLLVGQNPVKQNESDSTEQIVLFRRITLSQYLETLPRS